MNAFKAIFCENFSTKNLVFSNICVNTHTHTHTLTPHPPSSFRKIAKVNNFGFKDSRFKDSRFKDFKIQKFKIAPKSPAPSKSPPKGETFAAVVFRLFRTLLQPTRPSLVGELRGTSRATWQSPTLKQGIAGQARNDGNGTPNPLPFTLYLSPFTQISNFPVFCVRSSEAERTYINQIFSK